MSGVSKHLQAGQTVSLQALESGFYLITVVATDQEGHRVAEVGADYILCEDPAAGVTTRIPLHFIKSVTVPTEAAPQAA